MSCECPASGRGEGGQDRDAEILDRHEIDRSGDLAAGGETGDLTQHETGDDPPVLRKLAGKPFGELFNRTVDEDQRIGAGPRHRGGFLCGDFSDLGDQRPDQRGEVAGPAAHHQHAVRGAGCGLEQELAIEQGRGEVACRSERHGAVDIGKRCLLGREVVLARHGHHARQHIFLVHAAGAQLAVDHRAAGGSGIREGCGHGAHFFRGDCIGRVIQSVNPSINVRGRASKAFAPAWPARCLTIFHL